jgi:hypothetical protein
MKSFLTVTTAAVALAAWTFLGPLFVLHAIVAPAIVWDGPVSPPCSSDEGLSVFLGDRTKQLVPLTPRSAGRLRNDAPSVLRIKIAKLTRHDFQLALPDQSGTSPFAVATVVEVLKGESPTTPLSDHAINTSTGSPHRARKSTTTLEWSNSESIKLLKQK